MRKSMVFFLSFFMIAVLAACGMNNQGAAPDTRYDDRYNVTQNGNNGDRNPMYGNRDMTGNNMNGNMNRNMNRNNMNNNRMNGYNQQLADDITDAAARVNGVDQATAVVYGDNCALGLDVKNDKDAKNIEQKVRSAVNRVAPNYEFNITSDQDMMGRIQNMDQQMRNGNGNLQNIGNDFTQLIQDIGQAATAPFR